MMISTETGNIKAINTARGTLNLDSSYRESYSTSQ